MPVFVLGGAYAEADEDDTAFGGNRALRYVFNMSAACADPASFEADRAWVREFWCSSSRTPTGSAAT